MVADPTTPAVPRRAVPGKNGGTLYPAGKNNTLNLSGRPKGFIAPSEAYAKVSTLPIEDVRALYAGEAPRGWAKPISAVYVMAAGQFLAAMGGPDQFGAHKANATSAVEIADRTEGKVAQRHVLELEDMAKILAEKLGCSAEELLRDAAELARGSGK